MMLTLSRQTSLPNRRGRLLFMTMVHESFREDLTTFASLHPTLSDVSRISLSKYGRPVDILQLFKQALTLARLSLLRIRLLLHVLSICSHTSSFRVTNLIPNRSDTCLLCDSNTPEDLLHFISVCPALQPIRAMWLPKIYANVPLPSPHVILDHVLGISGLDSLDQSLVLRFLADLYAFRSILLHPQI